MLCLYGYILNTASCFHQHQFARRRSVLFSKSNSSSDPVIQIPLWQAQLDAEDQDNVIDNDKLKSQIDQAKIAGELGVRKVQLSFYEAFSSQSLTDMEKVWSASNDCRCIHPGMSATNGREDILNSWKALFNSDAFTIEPVDTMVDICGSTAICHCIEQIGNGNTSRLEALNIYKRENGKWKMTFHMASPILG